jgi:hypothetical protein
MGELQKPGMWKRISAYIFDAILLVTVAVGVAFLLSVLFRYDAHTAEREALRQSYEREYGVSFDIEAEDYEKLTAYIQSIQRWETRSHGRLWNIINEEIMYYFSGERTLDETVELIQSRASIWISEQS